MKILILDTETTDVDIDAKLVQLAYKDLDSNENVNEFFKPTTKISFGAMAIHHITNEKVADKPAFVGSDTQKKLLSKLNDNVVVAHNALFDINILKNEGVEIKEYIDTLRVSRHLIDSQQYSMQYLRYYLNIDIEESVAHDALGDIMILEKLFLLLVDKVKEEFNLSDEQEVIKKMQELSKMPVMLETINFGKHRGSTFQEISQKDKGYLEWLHGSESQKPLHDQNEDLVYTLKQYLI